MGKCSVILLERQTPAYKDYSPSINLVVIGTVLSKRQ